MMMKKRANGNQKGFTLLEIIVVLAVVGSLAAMLSPVVFRYIDDANVTQAQNDTNVIAAAIQQMYTDTGRWAFYHDGTGQLSHQSNDADYLTSNPDCDLNNDLDECDDTAPVKGPGWDDGPADALANQLILNDLHDNDYAETGSRAWRGPYLDTIPDVDPWGRSYLVNIGNADPNIEGTDQPWVIVISAGPDGNIDTAGNTASNANPGVAGDDVIARVK